MAETFLFNGGLVHSAEGFDDVYTSMHLPDGRNRDPNFGDGTGYGQIYSEEGCSFYCNEYGEQSLWTRRMYACHGKGNPLTTTIIL
jgi:hypothetical protein